MSDGGIKQSGPRLRQLSTVRILFKTRGSWLATMCAFEKEKSCELWTLIQINQNQRKAHQTCWFFAKDVLRRGKEMMTKSQSVWCLGFQLKTSPQLSIAKPKRMHKSNLSHLMFCR